MSCPRRQRRPLLRACLALLLLCLAPLAMADEPGIEIRGGDISLSEGVYYLDAEIGYSLSDAAREALESGVPLVFELQIAVERPREWWLDATVASLSQRYRIRYHALSGRYVFTNLNSGESRSFSNEQAMLTALGEVEKLPLIDRRLLEPGLDYQVSARARLDRAELPGPLRTMALLTPGWRLASEWFSWSLQV